MCKITSADNAATRRYKNWKKLHLVNSYFCLSRFTWTGNNFKQIIQVDTLSNIILTEKMPIPTVLKTQIATTPATPNKTVLAAG